MSVQLLTKKMGELDLKAPEGVHASKTDHTEDIHQLASSCNDPCANLAIARDEQPPARDLEPHEEGSR
jgi:hypothetical protein